MNPALKLPMVTPAIPVMAQKFQPRSQTPNKIIFRFKTLVRLPIPSGTNMTVENMFHVTIGKGIVNNYFFPATKPSLTTNNHLTIRRTNEVVSFPNDF